MSVTPYFELHIRPMFRIVDRDHMQARFDLWDYDSVKAKANDILRVLRRPSPGGMMPTKETGGPWPEGWIQVFEAWVAANCPRLSLAQGQYTARRFGTGQVMLNAAFEVLNGGEDIWLERQPSGPDVAQYTVLLRPAPAGVQLPSRRFSTVEMLPASVARLFVDDLSGHQELTVVS